MHDVVLILLLAQNNVLTRVLSFVFVSCETLAVVDLQ